MKDVFPMKVITHTIMHQKKKTDIDTHSIMYQANFSGGHIESKMYSANFAGGYIESRMYPANFAGGYSHSIMYPAKFAGGRSRLDLLLPSFLPSREEKKIQDRKNRPLGCRGVLHTPYTDRVREETKMQERRKQSIDSGAVLHTPHMDRVRIEKKKQDRIFCPLRGHSVGRIRYAPTTYRQETLFSINSREERTETKMQERRKQSIDSGTEWHTPFMRQGERDAVWRDTFLEQRARVAIWRDRRLEEKYSHARLQLSTFRENSKPYKSSLVALSEQLRDIFAA